MPDFVRSNRERAFTLVELLVATVILAILLLLSVQVISQTNSVWSSTNSKLEQFREARVGFDSLLYRLGLATLNGYTGYEYANATIIPPGTTDTSNTTDQRVPTSFGRKSDLRFISGPAITTSYPSGTVVTGLVADSGPYPTHAVFFVAPMGYTASTSYTRLPGLLNLCGYYIQWSNLDPDRPPILAAATGIYRFQLMQFEAPAEEMTLYAQTLSGTNLYAKQQFQAVPGWQRNALTNSKASVRPLANNVVALLLLPALSTNNVPLPTVAVPNPTPYPILAPNFTYDTEQDPANPTVIPVSTQQRNRLPPVVRVVLYTIDEASARLLNTSSASPSTMPNLYQASDGTLLFQDPTKLYPAVDGSDPGDLMRFEIVLRNNHLNFHRYEEAVETIPQPWSVVPNQ